jgi:hypothetical protein
MKLDTHIMINVLLALIVFKILDKLFLDSVVTKFTTKDGKPLFGLEMDSLEIA